MDITRTILVVDDEETILDSLADTLTLEGFQVLNASNGLEALATLQEQTPDLIIADIMMPEMNGYQFYQRVRRSTQHLRIPFIFLTAKGEPADIRYGKELGVDDYLQKPIHADDLISAVLGKLRRYDELDAARAEDSLTATDSITKKLTEPPIGLSAREIEVLGLIADGMTNAEIADIIFVEISTVKTHVSNVLSKLGVANRTEAVAYAFQAGVKSGNTDSVEPE